MTNQETNVTIAFETTLSSSLASGATTINVDTTTGSPAIPFYAVIDPGNDSKREVVLVDSSKTATTFVLSASSKRGQDQTSDTAHDSGAVIAVVPVAALWADINDRVEVHTHSGGTDGTAIATGDLTDHDKAAHDALTLDHGSLSGLADFAADHGTEHDAHDHSTAASTIASADLADHDKAVHDALNIDADTLDGLDSTAFAAVAGDTFTGAVTFDDLATFGAGVEGSLGADIHADTASQSAWPTGLSWQRVTSGSWPSTTGAVYTFNFGNDVRTWQLFIDSSPTSDARMHFRRWTASNWSSWSEVVTAEDAGRWQVVGSTEVQNSSIGGTEGTKASVNLTIPSDWSGYEIEAYASYVIEANADYVLKIKIDGTDQQAQVFGASIAAGVYLPGAIGGLRTGMSSTGTVTVELRGRTSSGSGDIERIYLFARAVRTS